MKNKKHHFSVRKFSGKKLRQLETGAKKATIINQQIDTIALVISHPEFQLNNYSLISDLTENLTEMGFKYSFPANRGYYFQNQHNNMTVFYGFLESYERVPKIKISAKGQSLIYKEIYEYIYQTIKKCTQIVDKKHLARVRVSTLHLARDIVCNDMKDIHPTDKVLTAQRALDHTFYYKDRKNPQKVTGLTKANSTTLLKCYNKKISNNNPKKRRKLSQDYINHWDRVFEKFKDQEIFRLELEVRDSHLLNFYTQKILSIFHKRKRMRSNFYNLISQGYMHFYRSHTFRNPDGLQDIHFAKMFMPLSKIKEFTFSSQYKTYSKKIRKQKKADKQEKIENKRKSDLELIIAKLLQKANRSFESLDLQFIKDYLLHKQQKEELTKKDVVKSKKASKKAMRLFHKTTEENSSTGYNQNKINLLGFSPPDSQ